MAVSGENRWPPLGRNRWPLTRRPEGLTKAAWQVSEEFGWAKTYDSEYVALARMLGCRLVTLDGKLRDGADRLGFVVTPAEL